MGELIVIAIIALIVFEPKQLRAALRQITKFLSKSQTFQHQLQNEIDQQLKVDQLETNEQKAKQADAMYD